MHVCYLCVFPKLLSWIENHLQGDTFTGALDVNLCFIFRLSSCQIKITSELWRIAYRYDMIWYAFACPESKYSIMLPALCFQNYFWIFCSSISCLSYKFPLMIYIQRFWYIHSCLVRHACFTGERWRRIRSSLGTIASKTNVQTSKYPHLKIPTFPIAEIIPSRWL